MRSVLVTLLALGVGSALLAQDKPKEPAPRPAEPKVKFNARGLPWAEVFQWLSKETGKPVIAPYKLSGSITIHVPEGAAYTLAETIDLINEAMMDQKYILIQRERTFAVVPTDEKIDGVPRVLLEDLDRRGNTEIVSIILPLKRLVAEEVEPDLKRMMSRFGQVAALKSFNKLYLLDNVATLKLIRATIAAEDKEPDASAETLSHVCKFIKAREAERILKDLLADGAKGKGVQITVDEGKNSILVAGPAALVAKAREMMKRIDVQTKPSPMMMKQYEVPTELAPAFVKILQENYKRSDSVRIALAGANTILVHARADEQAEIARLLGHGPAEADGKMRTIVLDKGSAASLADAIERMMKQMRKNPVNVLSPSKPVNPLPPRLERERNDEPEREKKPLGLLAPDKEVVLAVTRFELIGYSDYYGTWIASIRNQAIKGDSALLIDCPLPAQSRFQTDRKKALLRRVPALPEPTSRWVMRDVRTEAPLLELQVVRIEPLRVFVQVQGKLYAVKLGEFLDEGLSQPLDRVEIKLLGLGLNREDVLRKAMLSRLEFHKERKGYEGLFVNQLKDEKRAVATAMLPEEFDAPDTWSVTDTLGVSVVQIKVVKLEKDRIIFSSERKYYSIKPGGNLLDALAKPLTADEVKALKLPG